MKTKLVLMLVIVALLAGCAALALSPQTPEVIVRAIAGQTFEAKCRGYASVGGRFSMYLVLYERARYSGEEIQALAEAYNSEIEAESEAEYAIASDVMAYNQMDYLDADVGSAMIHSVTAVDDGYVINESNPNDAPVYMVPDGSGYYFARDAEGRYFLKEALEVSCSIAEDARYIDASDPDAAPVEHTSEVLVEDVQENRSGFDSVEVTFNERGEIAVLKRNPSEEESF